MDSASHILEIAERQIRQAGYNAVSFRDIAAEIGVKSASLHYHFPKKEDLGVALIQRYWENFQSALDKLIAETTSPKAAIEAYISIYDKALTDQNLVCLCAMLGAEAPGLPAIVAKQVKWVFEKHLNWLEAQYKALGYEPALDHAKTTLSLLEGAMIVSLVNEDLSVFYAARQMIMQPLDAH